MLVFTCRENVNRIYKFCSTGGVPREQFKFCSRLTNLILIKKKIHKSTVMRWLIAKLSFKLPLGSSLKNLTEIKLINADDSIDIKFEGDVSTNKK